MDAKNKNTDIKIIHNALSQYPKAFKGFLDNRMSAKAEYSECEGFSGFWSEMGDDAELFAS
jgi:hypothetical protein